MRLPRFQLNSILIIAALSLWPQSKASATQPVVSNLLPRGGQRGTEIEVHFTGARLGDAQEVIFDAPGIKVLEMKAVSDTDVKVKFKILPDAPLGIRGVYLRDLSDISNIKRFSVGTLKEISEKEPNNKVDAAQKIELNSVVNGVVDNEDVDNFSFDAPAGQRINFEVEGQVLGDTAFDPMIVLFDPSGREVASADDTTLLSQDCALGYTPEKAGVYTIQIREASFGGNGSSYYRLHVGTFPRPLGVFPAGGKPGEKTHLHWLGETMLPDTTTTLALNPTTDGLFTDVKGLSAPTNTPFRFSDLRNFNEIEPNNALDKATSVTLPCACNGIISADGDLDYYKFTAKKDQSFDVQLYARRLRSPLDSVVNILNDKGAGIVGNDDAVGPDSRMTFTAPADGVYYALVQDHLSKGSPLHFYRLEIAPGKPELSIVMPVLTGLQVNTPYLGGYVPVAIGNRTAAMLNVRRAGIGGELHMLAENLPPGVKAELVNAKDGADEVPVFFSADEKTTVSARLVDIKAEPVKNDAKLVGHLDFPIHLAKIQNDITVMSHEATRLLVGTTASIPFKIEVAEPKVPIVRNGRMNVLVKATRAKDYKEPIDLRLLWNPPGIGSGTARLEAAQTTATLELNANGAANLTTWKVAIIARANAPAGGAGPREVSSQLFPLTVSEPWVNVALDKARTDQGTKVEMKGKFETKHEFKGEAKVELIGLPTGVGTEVLKVNKDSKDLKYALDVTAKAPEGKFNPYAMVTVMDQGEPIVQFLGGTELRIDKPLPPPAGATPTPVPAPNQAAAPPPKKEGPQRGDRKLADGIGPFNKTQ